MSSLRLRSPPDPPAAAGSPAPSAAAEPAWHVRRYRGLVWLLRASLMGLAALWSLLLLLWLTLHWGILPHIDHWRGRIESRASAALGVPVRIGEIEVRSSGWVPSLEMREVVLLDTQARPALKLPRVVAALSPQSLLRWDLRFEQLYIEGAQLEVRRDARGRIFVAGFDVDAAAPDPAEDGAAIRWFLKQAELVVRGGSLRWIDEQRGAPPLTLTEVQLVLRNGLRSHSLQLDATPPAAWGERFSLRGRFTEALVRGDDWKRWSGTVHADLPRADVRELQRYLSLPFTVNEGDGALRAWVELRDGVPTAATVDLALRAVSVTLADRLQPLALAQIEARLVGRRQTDGNSLEVQRLSFHTGGGLHWPRGDVKLAWRQRDGGPTTGGEFSAQQLDLGVMASVAASLPLGEPVRKLLAETRPEGMVSDIALRFDGAPDAPTAYRLKGQVEGLSLASKALAEPHAVGRPGLRNARLQLNATERGGEARLQMAGGELYFPGVFDEPEIAFDQLGALLQWRIDRARPGRPPKVTLKVKDVRFANADLAGQLTAVWSTGPGVAQARGGRYPGQLEIDGQLTRGVATRVARYLPSGIPFAARDYVQRAVQGGSVGRTQFRVKGDLADFPYGGARAKDGEFRIAGQVKDVTLAYIPDEPAHDGRPAVVSPWPALTRLSGELIFDRASMQIRDAKAQLWGVQLSAVEGGIADLGVGATLDIQGQVNGPMAEMLRFVNATPVGKWTGQALAQTTSSGNGELKLALTIPLADSAHSSVKGSVSLAGNDVRVQPGTLLLGNARGRVDFSEHGFTIVGGSARLLGGDATFDGGTQADGSLRFTGQGVASADGLKRADELGAATRLASILSGQAAYRVALGVVRGQSELTVTSNLVGMATELPPPLRKSADAALTLRYQTSLAMDTGPNQPLRDTLRVELGSLVQAQYQREYPREGSPQAADGPRVLRGGIGINERAPTPASGVTAIANLGRVDVDAWQAVAERLSGLPSGTPPTPRSARRPPAVMRRRPLRCAPINCSSANARLTGWWPA